MAQHWDDFSDATPLTRYTEGDNSAWGAPTIVTDAGAPGGKALRLSSSGAIGAWEIYSILRNDLAAGASWEAVTCYRYSAASESRAGIYLRADRSSSSRGYIYGVWFLGRRDLFRQTSFSGAPDGAELGAYVAGAAPAQDTRRGVRAQVIGGDVKGKDWLWDASDPPGTPVVTVGAVAVTTAEISGSDFVPSDFGEPAGWTIERTDGSPLAAGVVGLGAEFQPSGDPFRIFDFDFFSVTDDPAAESALLRASLAGAHDASRFRVCRVADDAVVYDSGIVGASTGPHPASGLEPGTAHYAEAQYRDLANGVWSAWGRSANFTTTSPPAAPGITLSEIRRTTVKVSPDDYLHPDGLAQAARSARVRRISTDTIVVPAEAVAVAGDFYLTGLPEGPTGDGGWPVVDPDLLVEVGDQDTAGEWSWGVSPPFQTLNLWESGEFLVHLDVRIERPEGGGSVMQSYRSFGPNNRNWIRSARVAPGSIDTPIGSGTVVLHRQVGDESLAPLMTASPLNLDDEEYAPALDFGREIEVRAMLLHPSAAEPEPEDFEDVVPWRGITDDPDWPLKTGPVTVPWRDYLGTLSEAMIRVQRRYGSPEAPLDAFEAMQAIVDDTMGAGQFTLTDYTTGDRYLVRGYIPADVFVLQALEVLAEEWGGKALRQVDELAGSVIGVIEPNRDAEAADYTVSPGTYIEVHNISTAGKNRRTVVRGRAIDATTGRPLEHQIPAEEDVATDPLVGLFGVRFMELREATTIDTQAELESFTAAVYADVSVPPIPLRVETKFAPFGRVDHMVRWPPNGLLHDEPLTTAVLGLGHDFPGPGVGRTQWQSGGRPKAKYEGWTRRGVDIGGIGKRPAMFDVTLVQDTDHALLEIGAFNRQVDRWSAWAATDESVEELDGVPADRFLVAENVRPQTRSARWRVRDGTLSVLLRAYASDGNFVELVRTLEVEGLGEGEDEAPADAPGTPMLYAGAVVGGEQEATAEWVNTRGDLAIEREDFEDGVSAGIMGPIAPATVFDTHAYDWPVHLVTRLRYTAGDGLEGPWSGFSSPPVFLNGGLPGGLP